MENTDNEISLSQLFTVVKKSLRRGAIYVLVSLFIAFALLFAVRTFTSTTVYSTTLSFSEVKENMLSSMNYNKSKVVNNALKEKANALKIVDKVLENVSVNAIVPETVETTEDFLPTSFEITLKKDGDLKLTSKEYTEILDKISSEYVNAYALNTFSDLSVNFINEQSTEYIQLVDDLRDDVLIAYNTINNVISKNPSVGSFIGSNGKTLSGIATELKATINTLDNIKLTIVLNKVEKAEGSLQDYLGLKKATADGNVALYSTLVSEAGNALSAYSTTLSNIATTSSGNIYYLDDTGYIELYNQYLAYVNELANATNEKNTLDTYISKIADTTNQNAVATVNAGINSVSSQAENILKSYKETANEYNSNVYLTSKAKKVNPAHATTESIIEIKLILIVLIAVALIAYVVAFITTFSNLKKQKFFEKE